jgi:hypothetical protein
LFGSGEILMGKSFTRKALYFSRTARELFCSNLIIKNFGLFPQPVSM